MGAGWRQGQPVGYVSMGQAVAAMPAPGCEAWLLVQRAAPAGSASPGTQRAGNPDDSRLSPTQRYYAGRSSAPRADLFLEGGDVSAVSLIAKLQWADTSILGTTEPQSVIVRPADSLIALTNGRRVYGAWFASASSPHTAGDLYTHRTGPVPRESAVVSIKLLSGCEGTGPVSAFTQRVLRSTGCSRTYPLRNLPQSTSILTMAVMPQRSRSSCSSGTTITV